MTRAIFSTAFLFFLFTSSFCLGDDPKPYIAPPFNYIPPNGVVPNDVAAIAIAEAILKPIYGEALIHKEEPFIATLEGDVWIVRGTLHSMGKYTLGGTAEIKISKSKGCVINITHTM